MTPKVLPNQIYAPGLNNLSERLLAGANHVDFPRIRQLYVPEIAKIAEALVISPTVVLKVTGRSLSLPILLDFFQFDAIDKLLREGALRFLVWTHGVGSLGSVVMAMESPNPVERDSSSLAERDLRAAFPKLDQSRKEELIELFTLSSSNTDADQAASAIALAERFAAEGLFGDAVPGAEAFYASQSLEVTKAARNAAEALHETAVVLSNEYDLFEAFHEWDSIKRIARDISRNTRTPEEIERVYREASVPSVRTMVQDGRISPSDIVRIRNHRATREFRQWLWSTNDPSDGQALAEDFIKALDRGLNPHDSALYRNARTFIMSAVGGVPSAILGGMIGGAPGAAAGWALGTATSIAADQLVPQFFKAPDPRLYTDQVLRPLSKHKVHNNSANMSEG